MSEKISMVIVVVDLDCYKCYNKIRKILCQLQDQERIRTISFDDKSKTITIVGPFDPLRLACKIRCKGGKVVKDVHIVDNGSGKPSPPAPVSNGKQKHKEKPPTPEPPPPAPEPPPPAPEPPPPAELPPPSPVHHAPPDREMTVAMPAFIEETKTKARPLPPPCRPVECPAECVIPTVEIPSWPAPPVGPCGCRCCAPCYQGYYEGCRCCCCGRVYGYSLSAQPLLPASGGCGGYRGCRTFSDEDQSAACSIM